MIEASEVQQNRNTFIYVHSQPLAHRGTKCEHLLLLRLDSLEKKTWGISVAGAQQAQQNVNSVTHVRVCASKQEPIDSVNEC